MTDATQAADGAFQGAPGAFSEAAARRLLGESATLLPCATLDAVFAAVGGGRARSAVVPIENTLAGPVPGCADLIGRHDVHIVDECVERIAHALIAGSTRSMDGIRRAYSHPVALAQCEGFFRRHPHIQPVPAFDTAGALVEVIERGRADEAAIAGPRAAASYGGAVLADEIQDSPDNFTRFLRLDAGPVRTPYHGGWKTSVLCVLPNVPGALARALEPLGRHGLNLCRIESRPTRETPFEYQFHLDISPFDDAATLGRAIDELTERCRSLRVLGHYPAPKRA